MKMKEVHFHNIRDIDKALPVQKISHSVYKKSNFCFPNLLKDSKCLCVCKRESVLSYCSMSGRMEDDVNSYLWSRKRHLLMKKKVFIIPSNLL